jgi:putative signal transducing protein
VALVELALFHDPVAAEIVRGRLGSEGIEAILFGAGLASLGLGTMSPVRLMVESRDRVLAERILAG